MLIKRSLSLFWRWAWLILLGTAVAAAVAYIANKNIAPTYQSSSRLLVDLAFDENNETANSAASQTVQTYAHLLPTQDTLQETIEHLDLPWETAQLAGMISITVPENTQLIVVQVEDTHPERAANIANTLSQVFIEQHETREWQRFAQPIASLQQRLNDLQAEIDELNIRLNEIGTPGNPQEEMVFLQLSAQLDNAQNRHTDAYNRLNELQITQAKEMNDVLLIEPAQANHKPVRPKTLVSLLWAAFLGAAATAVIVIIVERRGIGAVTDNQSQTLSHPDASGTQTIIQADSLSELSPHR